MNNIEAFGLARKKARYGHNDWIIWQNRDGSYSAERRSPLAIKRAMLASGTAKRWWMISASSIVSSIYGWRDGVRMIRNARFGC